MKEKSIAIIGALWIASGAVTLLTGLIVSAEQGCLDCGPYNHAGAPASSHIITLLIGLFVIVLGSAIIIFRVRIGEIRDRQSRRLKAG
jgi:hypothetical protein